MACIGGRIACTFRNKKLLNLVLNASVECSRTQWDAGLNCCEPTAIQVRRGRPRVSPEPAPFSGVG